MDSAVPTEEQIILLDGDDVPESYRVSELIESNGGQVVHRYGSRVLIGSGPAAGRAGRPPVRIARADRLGPGRGGAGPDEPPRRPQRPRRVDRASSAEAFGGR